MFEILVKGENFLLLRGILRRFFDSFFWLSLKEIRFFIGISVFFFEFKFISLFLLNLFMFFFVFFGGGI